MKILIVDDQEICRTGLRFALQGREHMEILAELENGKQAIAQMEKELPDVILMDIVMPEIDGITATRQIKEAFPSVKVIMLTSYHAEEEVLASMAAGADAFCAKTIKISNLLQAIKMVMAGGIWIDPTVAALLIQNLPGSEGIPLGGMSPPESKPHQSRQRYSTSLTQREREVLGKIAGGKGNKEIAATLNVTIHTVKAHVCSIIQKLAVDDRTQAAIKAVQEGLI